MFSVSPRVALRLCSLFLSCSFPFPFLPFFFFHHDLRGRINKLTQANPETSGRQQPAVDHLDHVQISLTT